MYIRQAVLVKVLNHYCRQERERTGCACIEEGCEHIGWCDDCFGKTLRLKQRFRNACLLFLLAVGIFFALVFLSLIISAVSSLWAMLT